MTFSLNDSTGYLVNRLAALMRTGLERELEPLGVTAQQWALMAIVGAETGRGVASLAAQLGVDVGAASRLIDRLEEKGLVARRRSEHDARLARVELTPSGQKLLPKLVAKAKRVLTRSLKPLTTDEVQQLNALLRRLLD